MPPCRFRTIASVILCACVLLGAGVFARPAGKYAVVLQAGKETHEGMARAVHAFLYARELKEHGYDVVLIFDGAGTEWIEELTNPASASPLKPAYTQFKQQGIIEMVCDYCASAFQVRQPLQARGAPLVGEYAGHPSIARWIDQGYQLLIL